MRIYYCAICRRFFPADVLEQGRHRIIVMYGPDIFHSVTLVDPEA